MKKTFTRRGLFGMLAGLAGLAVKPSVQVDGDFLMYADLRNVILDNLALTVDEACADLIVYGRCHVFSSDTESNAPALSGVDYPRGTRGIFRVED